MYKLESFSDQMHRLGLAPLTKVLEKNIVEPPSDVIDAFHSKEKVIHLVRLRYANDDPIVIVTTYLPLICKDILNKDMAQNSLYSVLSSSERLRVCSATRQIEAVAAGKFESDYLKIALGNPIQRTTTIGYSATGEPIEYSIAKYRGDKNKFIVQLSI